MAASLPRPFRMTRRGTFLTLLALLAIPMAPSAAANDSWPARKAKHFVSSDKSIDPRFPWPIPTFLSSATDPGCRTPEGRPDGFRGFRRRGAALLQRDRRTGRIRPAGVFKSNGLDFFNRRIGVDPMAVANLFRLFEASDPVFRQRRIDLVNSALITFNNAIDAASFLFMPRVYVLDRFRKAAVLTLGFFQCFARILALFDKVIIFPRWTNS